MSIWLKAAGKWGSILAVLALVVTLLKQIIGFIAFLTTAIKLLVFVVFAAVFLGVAFMVFRAFSQRRKTQE